MNCCKPTFITHHKFHLYSPDAYSSSYRDFCDYRGQFEHVVNGSWSPYPLASPYKGGPQAKYITPDTSLTEEPQPAYYTFTLESPASFPGHNPTMTNLYSVDVVFTPDKTKWTRSVVLEACEDSNLSVGNALRHEPRKSPSVDKNGNPDGTGTGMGWFPGYAINVETGERLNIMFPENSSDIANNGADMLFNPTSDTANWGGCHFVYICGSSGSTCGMVFQDGSEIQRNFNNNGIIDNVNGVSVGGYFTGSDGQQYPYYDCGIYDEGKWLYEKFKTITDYNDVNDYTRKKNKMQLFNNVMWTSIVTPTEGEENYWLSDEATVYLRVSRPSMFYTSAVGTGPDNPLNGDVSKGQAYNLAPYIDADGDNHYDPSHGDYPSFLGDMALFFIFNDNYAEHTESGGKAIGLEVHGMVYGFDMPEDSILNNTLFFNYKLINRSQEALHDAYIGLWTDWDIGYANDDRVQCDVRRGTVYGYNGSNFDGQNSTCSYAYGANPPIQTLTVLGGPILPADGSDNPAFSDTADCSLYVFNGNNQYAINGSHFGNGIVDDERMGLTGFIYHNNDNSSVGDPVTAIEYYNYLQGIFRDNAHMQYGAIGHPDYGDILGPECRFMFPSNSDPCNWGIIDPAQWASFSSYQDTYFNYNGHGWTEEGLEWSPGDRRGLAIIGPINFESNAMHEIDYCMITVFRLEDCCRV